MERQSSHDVRSPPPLPKDFPVLAEAPGRSRVQLLKERFEQQARQAAVSRKKEWEADLRRVNVRSIRQRLFCQESNSQAYLSTFTSTYDLSPPPEEKQRMPGNGVGTSFPPDPQEEQARVSDADLSSLAQTLKALGFGTPQQQGASATNQ